MSCIPFLAMFGAAVSGCDAPAPAAADASQPPAFYRNLDRPGERVDPIAARDLISVYRRNQGLPTVAVDATLQKEAEAQAAAMANAGVASHSVRGALSKRLQAAHVRHTIAVENVSAGYHTLAEAFSGWRQSPPHNANMLAPKARRIGIATAYAPGSKYKVFWALVLTD
jgi:uncharacterized protein YkwD